MRTWKRLLPVVAITGITLLLSFWLYGEVMERGEEKCWQELSSTAEFIKDEIKTKFQDEIVKMHLIETILLQNPKVDAEDFLHEDTIQPTTIFTRIDVLYPDNTLITEGKAQKVSEEIDYEEIMEQGEYLTTRRVDHLTGKECMYYVLPVVKEEKLQSVLLGVVELKRLGEFFQTVIYDGQANICIIDTKDGSYIMDSWHDKLGNAYEGYERKKIKGYEHIDLQEELKNLDKGTVAFESKTTGKPIYMYYLPVDMFDWQVSIFAQEDVIFGYLKTLRSEFSLVGLVEAILLFLYFAWNIGMVRLVEKSNREIEKQKEELKTISYRDMLTSMYNRNKYTERWNLLKEQPAEKFGIGYIDLNGLKQINDSQMHDAGDRYICQAAKVIQEFFMGDCYRIGGDEFVILTSGMEQKEFADKIQLLKKEMEEKKVSISLGTAWEEICQDPDRLLKEAEREMYTEKERYYQTHEKKR